MLAASRLLGQSIGAASVAFCLTHWPTSGSLVALWLERYLLVMPSVSLDGAPHIGIPELAPTALMAGLFLLAWTFFARTFPMVSPRLAEITLNRELGHHAIPTYEHEETDPQDIRD